MAELQVLISKVSAYVEEYMSQFDGSHDFSHIKRVLGMSHLLFFSQITEESESASASASSASRTQTKPELDLNVITLSALLHNVGDKKYLQPGEDEKTLTRDLLPGFGAEAALAVKVHAICLGVSYSSENQGRAAG